MDEAGWVCLVNFWKDTMIFQFLTLALPRTGLGALFRTCTQCLCISTSPHGQKKERIFPPHAHDNLLTAGEGFHTRRAFCLTQCGQGHVLMLCWKDVEVINFLPWTPEGKNEKHKEAVRKPLHHSHHSWGCSLMSVIKASVHYIHHYVFHAIVLWRKVSSKWWTFCSAWLVWMHSLNSICFRSCWNHDQSCFLNTVAQILPLYTHMGSFMNLLETTRGDSGLLRTSTELHLLFTLCVSKITAFWVSYSSLTVLQKVFLVRAKPLSLEIQNRGLRAKEIWSYKLCFSSWSRVGFKIKCFQ